MITHPSSAATNTRHHSSPSSATLVTKADSSPPPTSCSWAHVPSARLIFASPGAIPPPPISRSLFLSADSPHID
ncbi:hypothetical protein COCVIDRAFT_37986 [Bipolaris victoriae FI3]|uniref:Uncharacterized protein n=1 Tax=Bipolaris victoriae (strain FI3) TaxID=930091 RepID=W7EJ99_BIPV3|nr:hypothetical protein COCVIDRAFT_37986 [Bipolaris victoriae FI3]